MKLYIVVAASIIARSNGFVVKNDSSRRASIASRTSLNGGFLDGSGKKSDVMKKEDDAMWIEDDGGSSGGGIWNPFAIAKSLDDPKPKQTPKAKQAAKAPPEPAKKSSGFKFPWDK